MNHFDTMLTNLALLKEKELEALAKACQIRIENKKKAREALRQELMENLQKALSDILHNDFSLSIENTECDWHNDYRCVIFDPADHYSIEIEQRFTATLILY